MPLKAALFRVQKTGKTHSASNMSNRDKPAKDKTEESEHGAPEKLDATEFKLLIECLKHAEGGIKIPLEKVASSIDLDTANCGFQKVYVIKQKLNLPIKCSNYRPAQRILTNRRSAHRQPCKKPTLPKAKPQTTCVEPLGLKAIQEMMGTVAQSMVSDDETEVNSAIEALDAAETLMLLSDDAPA
ncbi:hypothetical protein MMC20_005817 [Loxospora ochrophaea]|nr:hypothetical protein [Loxospora ochrophaea]